MTDFQLNFTGADINTHLTKVANAATTVTTGSQLVTTGAVKTAIDAIDTTAFGMLPTAMAGNTETIKFANGLMIKIGVYNKGSSASVTQADYNVTFDTNDTAFLNLININITPWVSGSQTDSSQSLVLKEYGNTDFTVRANSMPTGFNGFHWIAFGTYST
tara:strand:+ start:560 stop:1039 length:480 start_codon:yes stop_codon:yes gene_type:complete